MEQIDGPSYRTTWGLYDGADHMYVDPHRLVSRSVSITAEVVNHLLELFDWESLISDLPPELNSKIRESWAKFDSGVGHFLGWGVEPVYF